MNFGNLGFMEILLILVVVLLLFGARRLPEIGASFGKSIKEFKKGISDVDRSIQEETRNAALPPPPRTKARPGPSADPSAAALPEPRSASFPGVGEGTTHRAPPSPVRTARGTERAPHRGALSLCCWQTVSWSAGERRR
ncbi:MAG: twin-arginine translocase TatA/TatE family subunit [Gemmatimonadetes bacterium]|nr:twin-arginine translocase TatA/TatE family subunit [Gemmatimonadota bacterium]